MSQIADAPKNPATSSPIALLEKPRLRRDLTFTRHSYRGRTNYVVKDPATLRYFRLGRREYELAMLLDGTRDTPQILEELQRQFPDQGIDTNWLTLTFQGMMQMGLINLPSAAALKFFSALAENERKNVFPKLLWKMLTCLVSFKITLYDPDDLLRRMNKRLGFLWSARVAAGLAVAICVILFFLVSDSQRFLGKVPEFFGIQNLIILWFSMIVVKIVHEFGHGLSCKHFGGEVHEMGAMFIIGSPFLFCNATDSWMFPNKWKRLVVVFGGIYLELFVACMAALVWMITPIGLPNQIAFNVMVISSVLTILFNANPLMRFDGYYALSDFLEIPNLKQRSDRLLVSRLSRIFVGRKGDVHDPVAESMPRGIMVYGVASYLWTILVAYGILRLIGHILEPYGLNRIVQALSGIVLVTGAVIPIVSLAMHVRKTYQADPSPELRRRIFLGIACMLAVTTILYWIPVPRTVKTTCVLQGENRERVVARAPGFLRKVIPGGGDSVVSGQVIAELENSKILDALDDARMAQSILRAEESVQASAEDRFRFSLAGAGSRQNASRVEYLEGLKRSLTVTSPVDGTVVTRPAKDRIGTPVREGEVLFEILPAGSLTAVVALTQAQSSIVKPGDDVSLALNSPFERRFRGKVTKVDFAGSDTLQHASLAQKAGGDIPVYESAGNILPVESLFYAEFAFDNPEGILRLGMTGRTKIHCGFAPAGRQLVDFIRSKVRRDFL